MVFKLIGYFDCAGMCGILNGTWILQCCNPLLYVNLTLLFLCTPKDSYFSKNRYYVELFLGANNQKTIGSKERDSNHGRNMVWIPPTLPFSKFTMKGQLQTLETNLSNYTPDSRRLFLYLCPFINSSLGSLLS